jgi:hypothetical protein
VMEVAQVGAVFKLGLQVGVVELGCSSLGVQVWVFKSGVRWSKPPHHVKVNPLGEVSLGFFIKDAPNRVVIGRLNETGE